jgi:hypothetical protein
LQQISSDHLGTKILPRELSPLDLCLHDPFHFQSPRRLAITFGVPWISDVRALVKAVLTFKEGYKCGSSRLIFYSKTF